MDSYDNLPNGEITPSGPISDKFLELNIKTFKEACNFVNQMKYGYNTDKDDKMILFKEKMGTCTTKHGVIAALAEELQIPLYKNVGVYKFTEEISTGAGKIANKYGIPYIPLTHCFLVYKNYKFDLTEGNDNGKKTSIEEFIHAEEVMPFITQKNEYLLLKKVLKEKVLPSKEMKGIKEKTLLKARLEAIDLLKKNIN
ncbi:MAG: hypothetical protein ACFFAS_12080 [Promethearchaeota archaeon]